MGRIPARRRHLACNEASLAFGYLLVAAGLCVAGCGGQLVGGDEHQGSAAVEVVTADDLARGVFNTGLAADDEEGELVGELADESEMAGYVDPGEADAETPPSSEGVALNEPGEWIAETASGAASLLSLRSIEIEPSTDLVPGDAPVVTVVVETEAQAIAGAEAQVEVLAPSGARSLLTQAFDLPANATAYVHLATPELPVDGTYLFRPIIRDAAGQVLAQGLELELAVAAERLPMAKSSLASVMRQAAKFRYSHSCSARGCLARTKRGDCWAMSDWLWWKLENAGINARILQYRTKGSARHRSVQYLSGGRWRDVPYKAYGVGRLFRTTTRRPGLFVYRN